MVRGNSSGGLSGAGLLSAASLLHFLLTGSGFTGVDGPHVCGTVTRTYCDKQERRRLGWLLWALVPLLFVGPLAIYLGQNAVI